MSGAETVHLSRLDPDGCLVRGSKLIGDVSQLQKQNEKTGAETKPGGIIMVVQCKKESFL